MSAAQLAERDKAKSLIHSASQPAAPVLSEKSAPTQKTMPTQQSAPAQKPTHTRMPAPARALTNEIAQRSSAQPMSLPPVHSTPPANAASTADYLNCGPGRPLPATRAEFAAQVLKSIASSPPIPVPNAASDFSRNCRIW